jgi:hypothetical protein
MISTEKREPARRLRVRNNHPIFETEEAHRTGASRERQRQTILQLAQQALDGRPPGSCVVHFTFTCTNCGTRCAFEEPNVLFQRGECFACGRQTTVERARFLLLPIARDAGLREGRS